MHDSDRVLVKVTRADGTRQVVFYGLYKDYLQEVIRKYLLEPIESGKTRFIGNDNNYIRFTPNFAIQCKLLRLHYCKKHGLLFGSKAKKWFGF